MGTCALSSELPAHALDAHGDLAEQRRALGAIAGLKTVAVDPGAAKRTAVKPAGGDLARRFGCLACHGVDKAVVGPSFRDVAARYATGSAGAVRDADVKLVAKLKTGGAGAWGTIPMPGQPQVGRRRRRGGHPVDPGGSAMTGSQHFVGAVHDAPGILQSTFRFTEA